MSHKEQAEYLQKESDTTMIQEISKDKVVEIYQNHILTIDIKSNNLRYEQPGQTFDFNDEASYLYSDFQHLHANQDKLEALSSIISGTAYVRVASNLLTLKEYFE